MKTRTAQTVGTPPDEIKYWVALNRIPGIGRMRYQSLLSAFGSIAEAWTAGPGDLRDAGVDTRAARLITAERPKIDPDDELERIERQGIQALTWLDPMYPPALKETDDPPPVLYVRGDITAAHGWAVAVVGTRRPTPYGRQVAEEMAYQLAANRVCVVSGLARGVDAIAHRAALQAGGKTVAVMACGLDMVYPPEHSKLSRDIAEGGAVLSEQPLGTQPRGDYFPRRNRILSGLSLGVLVVEGDSGSGALITARMALDQGREVFAVPGSIFSPQSRGPNQLIRQSGGKLVTGVSDILEELNLTAAPQQMELQEALPATDTEADLLRHISKEPVHIDEVCRDSGLPAATVSSLLAMMELKGLIREVGGKAYVRAR